MMTRKVLVLTLALLLLAACGKARPLVHDIAQPDEMPPGPGLFSGDDEGFVFIGKSGNDE